MPLPSMYTKCLNKESNNCKKERRRRKRKGEEEEGGVEGKMGRGSEEKKQVPPAFTAAMLSFCGERVSFIMPC